MDKVYLTKRKEPLGVFSVGDEDEPQSHWDIGNSCNECVWCRQAMYELGILPGDILYCYVVVRDWEAAPPKIDINDSDYVAVNHFDICPTSMPALYEVSLDDLLAIDTKQTNFVDA